MILQTFLLLFDEDYQHSREGRLRSGSLQLDARKRELIDEVDRVKNSGLTHHAFTIGFARRMTAYKRPMLIIRGPERLRRIAAKFGLLQLIFAGKAHPSDIDGKALIAEINRASTDATTQRHQP